MPTVYSLGYRIFKISQDGLLKTTRVSEGYGYYRQIDDVYDTPEAALAQIERDDLGSCVILPCSRTTWLQE